MAEAVGANHPIVTMNGVEKTFGRTKALQGVSLEVQPGEVVAVLGPNGAGKTTAISIMLGLRKPDKGEVRLLGIDPRRSEAHLHVGATPQETAFPATLRVAEVLDLVRVHYPNPRPAADLLQEFGLKGLEKRQTGGLSGGQKRRLAVALAFAGNPKAVFLDEPTTALDVESRRHIWEAVRRYIAAGGTILLTTHYLEEAEALATRVIVIDHGQVITEGTVDQIKSRVQLKQVRCEASSLPDLPTVVKTERKDNLFVLYTPDSDLVVRTLVEKHIAFKNLEVLPTTLEEAFLVLTGGAQ